MKNQFILFLGVIIISFSCNEIDKLTQFNMEYNEEVVIPSATGVDLPVNIFTPDIESNAESQFAVNDTRKDMIEHITLTSMELNLTSPAEGDFSFLKSISIYISADGLEEQKIAWLDEIPAEPGNILDLETSDVDLQEYIKKDNFSMKVNTVTDEIITSDHHIDVNSIFFVDAKILGI